MWELFAGLAGLGGSVAGAGVLAYATRGRSSSLLGPSIYHGDRRRASIALTFDDGPTPQTMRLLDVLDRFSVKGTFFVCGTHVRKRPEILRAMVEAGHEIGNHSDTHKKLWFQSPEVIRKEVVRAQNAIATVSGVTPTLFRAPYGVRWFGLNAVQRELGLLGVMWTVIGNDWLLDANGITARITGRTRNGDIICLHDGRELASDPDISNTIEAVRRALPIWLDSGFSFETVSELSCLKS